MPSEIIWGTLAGLFISAIYLVNKVIKRGEAAPGATWMQRHVVVVGIAAIVAPLIIGVILINTVFGRTTAEKRVVHRYPHGLHLTTAAPPEKPEPILKLVISDGSVETDLALLNRCLYDEVTVVQNGMIRCTMQQSPEIQAWMNDLKVHERTALKKYIRYQVQRKLARRNDQSLVPKASQTQPIMRQSFWWLAAPTETKTVEPAPEAKKEPAKKSFRDRYAELFYFLALVLGVLGKYFWDYYEDKRTNKAITFEPHLIVMSFIIAALVYYSIQQGIEKEASKLSARGVVFAFNNGFMWQTILTSVRRSTSDSTKTPETANTEPVN